jgi:hypothetical protein
VAAGFRFSLCVSALGKEKAEPVDPALAKSNGAVMPPVVKSHFFALFLHLLDRHFERLELVPTIRALTIPDGGVV